MQQMNYGMMGYPYCPPQPAKKQLDPHFQFDVSVLIVVTIAMIVALGFIAYDKATGVFAYRRKMNERKKLVNGRVPGWVFRDRDSMACYLRMDLGYEPEPWRIEMLEKLLESRIAMFRRQNIGKYPAGFDIRKKITEET